MPRLTGNRLPKYRKHASGQAVISLDGRDVYLGPHGTKSSHTEYDRVVAEWMANGRTLVNATADLTINEIAVRYLGYAKGYYKKNGKQTDTVACIKVALRHICGAYGRTPAREFGPLALAAIRAVYHDILDFRARVLAILAGPSWPVPFDRLLGQWRSS